MLPTRAVKIKNISNEDLHITGFTTLIAGEERLVPADYARKLLRNPFIDEVKTVEKSFKAVEKENSKKL